MTDSSVVRFNQSYNGYDPKTVFSVNPQTKTLSPITSGSAYTGAGYQFGQETVGNPGDFAGFSVGAPINSAGDLASVKAQLNAFQNQTFNDQNGSAPVRASSNLQSEVD